MIDAPSATAPLFRRDEIAWLADEASRARLRAMPRPGALAPTLLPAAHRRDAAFADLAAHPRLLREARERLGGPVALEDSSLWFGGEPAAGDPNAARIVVELGAGRVRFVADYRRCRPGEAAVAERADDCLWLHAAFCAG